MTAGAGISTRVGASGDTAWFSEVTDAAFRSDVVSPFTGVDSVSSRVAEDDVGRSADSSLTGWEVD